MSFAPSWPPAPDSEARRLPAPSSFARRADRVRALALRLLAVCHVPSPDAPTLELDAQFAVLDATFRELVIVNTELHGLDERRGLSIALKAQAQALATALAAARIEGESEKI